METSPGVSLMVMYEDESVEVRYGSGAELQLSPCGCEFMLVKAADPSGHPLQTRGRVRQRTRFATSAYRELLMAALAFRNKHAGRPYLPKELIPARHLQPFCSADSAARWPEWSSCAAEVGLGGKAVVRSEEGRAELRLSLSGEEFSVEFTCRLSRPQQCLSRIEDCSPDGRQSSDDEARKVDPLGGRARSGPIGPCSRTPQVSAPRPNPEEMYQSTTVVQHHSCLAVPPAWRYPLSLARHHRTSKAAADSEAEATRHSREAERTMNTSVTTVEERTSILSQALPLTCASPHWHRWKFKDPLAKTEQSEDSPTELVKVMWCQGVTYRTLSGAVPVIEVSPGDGSVIRSNGVLNNYFTHHKPDLQSAMVREVIYHMNSLPPDVPGQVYSVCSVVSRASRILSSYSVAKQSLKLPVTPSCLQEESIFSKPAMANQSLPSRVAIEKHASDTQMLESRSDLVAAELEKIKRFSFLMDNSHLFGNEKGRAKTTAADATDEAVSESCVAEALQRTSRAIQDIDVLLAAAALTG